MPTKGLRAFFQRARPLDEVKAFKYIKSFGIGF